VSKNYFEPGDLVINPEHPEWGVGQVQSSINNRITANFDHNGKVVINSEEVILEEYIEDNL